MGNNFLKSGLVVFFVMSIFFSCKEEKIKLQAVIKDSCLITVTLKNNNLNTNTLNDSITHNSDTLIDLMVSLITEKNIEQQKPDSELFFGMDNKFELQCDTSILSPIFCQPIATGVTKKFAYWVSFEANKDAYAKKKNTLVIQPNLLVKDSVHYKL